MASVEAQADFIEIRPQTDALQSLIQETQQEIRDQVDQVPPGPTIVIRAPSNSTMILEEYRKSYFQKVRRLMSALLLGTNGCLGI